jgi:hypothetical protein
VVPANPSSNFSATTVSTYQSSISQTFKWDLSTAYAPIIGNVDTFSGASLTSSQKKEILYYENSEGDSWSDAWKDGYTIVLIDAGGKECTTNSSAAWSWPDTSTPTTS